MIPESPELIVAPAADVVAANAPTPQGRLIGGLVGTNAAGFIALSVPQLLMLSTHVSAIAGVGDSAAYSLVSLAGGIAAVLANPFGGRISDRTAARFGRRRTWILTGGIIGAVLLVAMAFTNQVWEVAVAWAAIEIVLQFQAAASSALAADQVPPAKRGTISGLIAMIALGAPVIGFGVVSVPAIAANPVLQWLVLAVLSLIGVIVTVVLIIDPQHHPSADQPRFTLALVLKSYWVSPRRHPAFGWAWFVRLLVSVAWGADIYFTPIFQTRFHVSSKAVSGDVFILTLIGIVCVMVTAVVTGTVSDRIHRQKPFIMVGGLVLAVGIVILAFAPAVEWEYIAAGVMPLGYGTVLATDFAMCIRVLPNPETFGKDFGVLNIASTLPGVVVPLIGLTLIPVAGYVPFFIAMAVIGVVGAIIVIRVPDIGREGNPRWALITRGVTTPD